jgi:hypothetical protein
MRLGVVEYDLERMPLGKLTKDQILAGYQTLKDIEALINVCSIDQ